MKAFLSLAGMGRSEILRLADAAIDGPSRGDDLKGTAVALMFFEPSTRTRLSFQLAAARLQADVLNLDPARSSSSKGESVRDTAATVSAIGADVLVVRHQDEGIPEKVHEWTGKPVINAGDGCREHPTQGLIDVVTLKRHFGDLAGLRVALVGDVTHSRVAGSLLHALPAVGADLYVAGPDEFLPSEPGEGVRLSGDLDTLIPEMDVIYLLRIQRERGADTTADYSTRFGMDESRAARMKEGAVVMHPGPINRGVEISDGVADGPRSLILSQVSNGVPVRMAILREIARGLR